MLIQRLLPTSGAASADGLAPLAQTRGTGSRASRRMSDHLQKGLWTAPDGQIAHDDVVMVEVVTDTFDLAWWRTYAATLAERF